MIAETAGELMDRVDTQNKGLPYRGDESTFLTMKMNPTYKMQSTV